MENSRFCHSNGLRQTENLKTRMNVKSSKCDCFPYKYHNSPPVSVQVMDVISLYQGLKARVLNQVMKQNRCREGQEVCGSSQLV